MPGIDGGAGLVVGLGVADGFAVGLTTDLVAGTLDVIPARGDARFGIAVGALVLAVDTWLEAIWSSMRCSTGSLRTRSRMTGSAIIRK